MSSSQKVVTLKSSDGEEFHADAAAMARECQTIKHIFEEDCAGASLIPLHNVASPALTKIIEYCNMHRQDDSNIGHESDELKKWDDQFVVSLDTNSLLHLIMAANYLNAKRLLDRLIWAAANLIKGKNPEALRKMFNIKNDLSPEEEEQLRKENEWAFQ